jgi:hypothetical protein
VLLDAHPKAVTLFSIQAVFGALQPALERVADAERQLVEKKRRTS